MLPCSATEHLRFMAKGVCTLKSASSHSCAEVLLLSCQHVAKVTLTKRSIVTNHHNGMSRHKIWNTRCSRRMQKEVILLEGKRPKDLRCQCMQQAKIDTKHMIHAFSKGRFKIVYIKWPCVAMEQLRFMAKGYAVNSSANLECKSSDMRCLRSRNGNQDEQEEVQRRSALAEGK